jgi:hypothetical protein
MPIGWVSTKNIVAARTSQVIVAEMAKIGLLGA